jgi:N6-adenosine-specific RNA methylase IME4
MKAAERKKRIHENYDEMDTRFANGLELFAREHRPGWCCWGDEV